MASQFHVQKPYVLTSLPRPLDPTTGTYVVGDVYGYAPGSRKRKRRRAELTVGIDGEAINIYDVSSSRLVTSYPIPPQSRISCPASSVRCRSHSTKDVSRYTYAASEESHINKVTLFKDSVGESGKTDQKITSFTSPSNGHPVVWLAPVFHPAILDESAETSLDSELLVTRADGEITCLDGESLRLKWTSAPLAMLQDLAEDARINFTVEFCRTAPASEVMKGIFKDTSDALSLLSASSQGIDEDMEVLILVSSSGPAERRTRHLHIVGRLPSSHTSAHPNQGVIQLHVMPLVPPHNKKDKLRSYRLDVRNGALLELHHHTIIVHDLTGTVPKISSTMQLDGATSFLSLSRTSLLCSTNTRLGIFNPVYRSLQNTVDIDLAENAKDSGACQLVAYFSPLERAIAIVDSNLVAIQLEAPKNRHSKRRAEGLLIDSIGRGLPTSKRDSAPTSALPPKNSIFSNYLPGSIREDYWEKWTADQKRADSLLNSNDIAKFETFLAEKFGIPLESVPTSNGDSAGASVKSARVWRLPKSRASYPSVDRRWILYAISRSFQWNSALRDDSTVPRLIFQLPQSNILNYLTDAGHLTLSNLRAAFRDRLVETEGGDDFLAEEIVTRLSEIDPSLELLVVYLSATSLGAVEVLFVLKALMKSLELVKDPNKTLKLVSNGTGEDGTGEDAANDDDTAENEHIGMELDDLEDEIQKTVSYLNNEDASIRGRGLSVAFARLGAYPRPSAVRALRATFKPEEVLSLMYVLRIELVKGGWTDRYLEIGPPRDSDDEDGPFNDAPPDGIIKLIADLLGLCLDSLGPGGWLLNDAMHMQAGDDAADFVGSLTHEVSAALEGLEQTVYLRSVLSGPLKYLEAASKKVAAVGVQEVNDTAKPVAIRVDDLSAGALPLSLKTASRVSSHKVVSGGEVVQRSLRETGHLISQKVGAYSLERIVI